MSQKIRCQILICGNKATHLCYGRRTLQKLKLPDRTSDFVFVCEECSELRFNYTKCLKLTKYEKYLLSYIFLTFEDRYELLTRIIERHENA